MLVDAVCQVRNCKWYLGIKNYDFAGDEIYRGDLYDYHCCSAFPEYPGIPASITKGKDLHMEVHKNQTGKFTYEPKTIEEEKEKAREK